MPVCSSHRRISGGVMYELETQTIYSIDRFVPSVLKQRDYDDCGR